MDFLLSWEWFIPTVMFTSFFVLVFLGVPISFSIGIATLVSAVFMLPFNTALIVAAQKVATGLDSFSLLAIPFFILAGSLMNSGGIATRLINFSQILVGRIPGSLGHTNVMANMMFGSISGSAVAAAAAVGGTMSPLQVKAGYDPSYSAAINVSSCISGLLIPPSNVMIVYALTAGGISVATLFMAGYVPGILMGLGIMVMNYFIAKKRNYPVSDKPTVAIVLKYTLDAIPSLLLVVVVMGGILGGVFMDMTPAVLIFTPIFLPIVKDLGMDPVHFGIMMIFNLCIGLCTPPVGSALFVGCSVSGVKLQDLIKPMLPFFAVLIITLLMVTYIPSLSLFLPNFFGL